MKLRNALLAATVLAVPVLSVAGVANAQPVTGLYVGAGAGYNYLQETKVKDRTINGLAVPSGQKLKDDGGPVVVASVGWGFGNGIRAEIEGDYRQTHFRFKGGSGSPGTGGGNLLTYGAMANVYYDFGLAFGLPVAPYVGVGAGYAWTQLQNANENAFAVGGPINFGTKDKGGVAAQGILGIAYNLPFVPGLSLTAEYRFYGEFDSPRYRGTVFTGAGAVPASIKLEDQYNHAILIGLRYAFNAAPPPPPPAPAVQAPPAVQPSRSYLVFFDWDRADLTARARQIVAEAAQNSTRVQYTRIQVSGHADLSGTPQYNQRLSLRRAETVAAELVKDGVPRAAIDIHAYGDSRPLVPTARGVREPQNRRVEIVLQ